MSKRQIEAVIFDLGETLLNFGRLDKSAFFDKALFRSYSYLKELSQPVGSYRIYRLFHIWGIRWHLLRSWMSGSDFDSLEMLKGYGRKRNFHLDDSQWEELNWRWYRGLSEIAQVEAGTVDALRELGEMGLKVGLLSNTFVHKSCLERDLEREGLLRFLPERFYSYDFDYRKPDVRIFQEVAQKMDVAAERTIYVGDRVDNDVEGSLAAGMLPVLKKAYTNENAKIPEHTQQITTIAELPELIRRICEIPCSREQTKKNIPFAKKDNKMATKDQAFQKCINPRCGREFGRRQVLFKCPQCGDLLDIKYDWDRIELPSKLSDFADRWAARSNRLDFSGVWRFRELLNFCGDEDKVSIGEGQTILQPACRLAKALGMKADGLFLQYEGMNPSGSFKDNGMTAAFSHAKMVGAVASACASTGNTSASMALYAHSCGLKATVFVGEGKIAFGKLSQAMDFGAHTIQVAGDFDDCMRQVQDVCRELNIYLVNSLNPFRLEGQKTIMLRIIEGLNWQVPDWIVVPGGNLGNSSAFGKVFAELKELGLIDRIPRLAVINASGANTLTELVNDKGLRWNNGHVDQQIIDDYYANLDATHYRPDTIASAIEISRPVNLKKCLRALDVCKGVVLDVPDEEILDAKAQIGVCGLGCEPASAATLAGLKHLLADGTIDKDARVGCVLTGHPLKDSDATVNYHSKMAREFSNPPVQVENDLQEIIALVK